MKVLSFDTSSTALSVAVLENEKVMAETLINIKKNHSISLMPTIDFLMQSIGWQPNDLNRIVVAHGPGSYTGLRVAVATAKMLAYSLGIELVGVSSLLALIEEHRTGLIIPIMDARRQNVYAGFYKDGESVAPERHMPLSEVLDFAKGYSEVCFVGETLTFEETIRQELPKASIHTTLPSATRIGRIGLSLEPEVIDSFVPHYLKRVEAEENWLKTHDETGNEDYVKRV